MDVKLLNGWSKTSPDNMGIGGREAILNRESTECSPNYEESFAYDKSPSFPDVVKQPTSADAPGPFKV